MRKHLFAWLGWVSLTLSGCAGCPPMKAGWYLLDQGPGKEPELLIALVNEGASTTLKAASVNPTKDDGAGVWDFEFEGKEIEMKPGQIVLLNATENGFPNCMVPARVALQCANASRLSKVQVTGSLPNYVPHQWLKKECMPKTRTTS